MKKYITRIIIFGVIIGAVVYACLNFYWPRSAAFDTARAYVLRSPQLVNQVGEPMTVKPWVADSWIRQDSLTGEAELPLTVKGPRSTRNVRMHLFKRNGSWAVQSMDLT